MIVVSGTTANDGAGGALHRGDTGAQTVAALRQALDAVERLGGRIDDVVRTRVYLVPDADWPAAARAHAEVFGAVRPANTMLYVHALDRRRLPRRGRARRGGRRVTAGPSLRTSLRLNNDVGVDEFVELARVAESLGFDQIWISNDLFFRSAPVMLAAAATATSTIRLGTCVLNPYSIHPAEIAMAAATLQEVSHGRFLLGLAAGATDFLHWAGIERPAPLRRTREAIVAIRELCAGRSPADVAGSGVGWDGAARLRMPRPTPIYLGAMSPRMIELIGDVADGGLPLLYPPETLGETMAASHRSRRAVGASRPMSTSPRASGCRSTTTRRLPVGRSPRSSSTSARPEPTSSHVSASTRLRSPTCASSGSPSPSIGFPRR